MLRFLRMIPLLLLFACSVSPAGGRTGRPVPRWLLPDCPRRAVFVSPPRAGAHVMVTVPLGSDLFETSSFAAYNTAGDLLPHRVVHVDSEKASVLVCIGKELNSRRRQEAMAGQGRSQRTQSQEGEQYVLYYGTAASASAESQELRDPLPVAVEIHKVSGKGVPNSWAKMFYLYRGSGKPVDILHRAGFGRLRLPVKEEKEMEKKHRWIVHQRSILLCPEDGVYRFALDCRDAGFLLVDGEIAASWPGEHRSGEWHSGAPMLLKAGPHRLEVFNSSKKYVVVRVGWSGPAHSPAKRGSVVGGPGSRDIVSIPDGFLITAWEAVETRIERMNKSLHPNFSFDVMPAYSFRACPPSPRGDGLGSRRGTPSVFIPVRFKNTTENWITDSMRCRWHFDGWSGVEGKSQVHVYIGAKQHRSRLEVRDSLGFVGSCERMVDCRLVQPREYAVSCEIVSVPAVCFARDVIQPILRVSGSLPDKTSLEAAWETREVSGDEKTFIKDIRLTGRPVYVPLAKVEAGSLACIRWRVMHHGAEIRAGIVKFLVPPFGTLPVRVEGDCLYDGKGTQLVLMPYGSAGRYNQSAISTRQAFGRLVCIDDSLGVSGLVDGTGGSAFDRILARIVDGLDRPAVKYVPLPAWDNFSEAYGPLLKLVQAPAAVDSGTDVVILSIGLRDILELKDLDMFERHVAALSDIISVSMKRAIVWVTPPPYPPDPDRIRPFAAAIRKVADTRGIPVADLFSAFLGMSDNARPFFKKRSLALSDRGQKLSAQVIVRALLLDGNGTVKTSIIKKRHTEEGEF